MTIKTFINDSRSAKVARHKVRDANNEIYRYKAYTPVMGFNLSEYDTLCLDSQPSLPRLKMDLTKFIHADVLPGEILGSEDHTEIKVWFGDLYLYYNKITKVYKVWSNWESSQGFSIDEVFEKWYNSDESELEPSSDWIEF